MERIDEGPGRRLAKLDMAHFSVNLMLCSSLFVSVMPNRRNVGSQSNRVHRFVGYPRAKQNWFRANTKSSNEIMSVTWPVTSTWPDICRNDWMGLIMAQRLSRVSKKYFGVSAFQNG